MLPKQQQNLLQNSNFGSENGSREGDSVKILKMECCQNDSKTCFKMQIWGRRTAPEKEILQKCKKWNVAKTTAKPASKFKFGVRERVHRRRFCKNAKNGMLPKQQQNLLQNANLGSENGSTEGDFVKILKMECCQNDSNTCFKIQILGPRAVPEKEIL